MALKARHLVANPTLPFAVLFHFLNLTFLAREMDTIVTRRTGCCENGSEGTHVKDGDRAGHSPDSGLLMQKAS